MSICGNNIKVYSDNITIYSTLLENVDKYPSGALKRIIEETFPALCTVSKDGHTMKFKVDNQGNRDIIGEKEGDILYLMSLLESDPAQIEAARKRDKFFKDHQLANEKTQQRTIITKVDGKPTLVLEFVNTENGKYYYLDDNGDQVIPD